MGLASALSRSRKRKTAVCSPFETAESRPYSSVLDNGLDENRELSKAERLLGTTIPSGSVAASASAASARRRSLASHDPAITSVLDMPLEDLDRDEHLVEPCGPEIAQEHAPASEEVHEPSTASAQHPRPRGNVKDEFWETGAKPAYQFCFTPKTYYDPRQSPSSQRLSMATSRTSISSFGLASRNSFSITLDLARQVEAEDRAVAAIRLARSRSHKLSKPDKRRSSFSSLRKPHSLAPLPPLSETLVFAGEAARAGLRPADQPNASNGIKALTPNQRGFLDHVKTHVRKPRKGSQHWFDHFDEEEEGRRKMHPMAMMRLNRNLRAPMRPRTDDPSTCRYTQGPGTPFRTSLTFARITIHGSGAALREMVHKVGHILTARR